MSRSGASADAIAGAPAWRREPYRLFFPLGVVIAWAGVSHWLALALDLTTQYRSIFHAQAQIQGFMACFAVGFLYTAIPRRTQTAPPAAWEMAIGLAAPIATTALAWLERIAWAQAAWMVLLITLCSFTVRRMRRATRPAPDGFVWLPIALAMGLLGSIAAGVYGVLGRDFWWLHELGRDLVLQGTFTALVLGAGSLALPLITRGDAPPDARPDRASRLRRAGHVLAAAALLASFGVDALSKRWGLALRAATAIGVLLAEAQLWRLPRRPGWNAWVVWAAAWLVPVGFAAAAWQPAAAKAGLHITFIGGFALLALSIGAHVTLSHGGHQAVIAGRPWQVLAFAALLLVAAAFRSRYEHRPVLYDVWLGVSAGCFLVGTLAWASLVVPRLRPAKKADEA